MNVGSRFAVAAALAAARRLTASNAPAMAASADAHALHTGVRCGATWRQTGGVSRPLATTTTDGGFDGYERRLRERAEKEIDALTDARYRDAAHESTADASDEGSPASDANAEGKDAAEYGGPKGPEPTRFGDWERGGRCSDF